MNSPDVFFTAPLTSKHHRREVGKGFLRASNGGEVGCRFVLEQLPAGDIVLRCLLDTVQSEEWRQRPPSQEWFNEYEDLEFDLETEDGYQLENLQFHVGSGGLNVNGHQQSLEFDLSHIDLRRARPLRSERPVAYGQFYIVNFEVNGGNAGLRLSNMWRVDDGVIALRLGNREFWLCTADNATETIKELKATKGIDVTATLMLPLHSLDEWDEVESQVDDLCTVLTLLSGNRVTWISARAVDSWGYALWARWRDSVTNPYTTNDMLNTLSNSLMGVHALTVSYVPIIERMMSQFSEADQKWNIRAAINTWHETVISDHFAEQRGLLVAACVEMLRTRYLRHGGRETIIDAFVFDTEWEQIRDDVEAVLTTRFPVSESWNSKKKKSHLYKLRLMSSHVRGLNYYTFADSLQNMARELGMMSFAPDDEASNIRHRLAMQPLDTTRADENQLRESITCFVRIRDHLTHQGVFVLTEDNESRSSNLERIRQLHFLQQFAAAFLCSALGWTQPLPNALDLPQEHK